jgi:hypothetical protein
MQVAIGFWLDLWSDPQKAVITRRGWEKEKKKGGYGMDYERIALRQLPLMSDDELAGFLMELSVVRQIDGLGFGDSKDRLFQLAALYQVDPKAIEKQVGAELLQKQKAKLKKKTPQKGERRPEQKKAGKTVSQSAKTNLQPGDAKTEDVRCEQCARTEQEIDQAGWLWNEDKLAEGHHVCTGCRCRVNLWKPI